MMSLTRYACLFARAFLKRGLSRLVVLSLFSMACQVFSTVISAPPEKVLFRDDFSTSSSGWSQAQTSLGAVQYVDGIFRIRVEAANTHVWGIPGLHFRDTLITVEALKVTGVDDNLFGVICRYRRDPRFYAFLISSDGYYGIAKVQHGKVQLLSGEALLPTEAIRQGKASNRIQAECVGSFLVLRINEEGIAVVQDEDFPSGDVGLIAGSMHTPGVEIHFDDFIVRKP